MTLYERYTTGEDHAAGVYGRYRKGQTFTIGNTGANENHNITSVKLKLFRQGSPGIITVQIRATSGGKPTGSVLADGATDGNTLTTAYAGEWREIAITPYELSANTQYVLIIIAPYGDGSNVLAVKEDQTSPTYTGGSAIYTIDSGSTWTIENTEFDNKDVMFEEYGGPPPCSSYVTQSECEANNCYWWNGACHDAAPTCEALNNEPDCTQYGCYWYDGSCHSEPQGPPPCSSYQTPDECVAAGCSWYQNSCHDPVPCDVWRNEYECLLNNCYWYDNSCHSEPPPETICDWITDKGGPDALAITDVSEIVDSYLSGVPPTGYSFVPTLQNTFGVIDYYLGFNGDPSTGCVFFA